MAGAFSGHLLSTFNSGPAPPSTPVIVTSGAMSFDARAHGNPAPSTTLPTSHVPSGFTEDSTTAVQIAALQAKLNKKLGPEYVSQRPGPGGGPKLTYAEGWKIINLANEVFGFNGWSSSIVSIATDFVDYSEESRRFNVGVTAIVRVTLRDGAYHEDVGYGLLENAKSKGGALDKCKKEAVTDALKRTLRNFGNLLGNCLYDKSYAQEVVKIKVPPAKFDKDELYRRPEFQGRISSAPAPAPHGQPAVSEPSSAKRNEPRVKVEHQPEAHVPRHLRQEVDTTVQRSKTQARALSGTPTHTSASRSGPGTTDVPANCGPLSIDTPKLTTSVQTPAQVQRPPPRAPPPRAVATSPLARTRSTPERHVSFAEPILPRARSTDVADVDIDGAARGHDDEDEDAFPLSTQDDAFLATVDLGEGDLGRPIDFEEGMSGVSMMDAPVVEPGPDSAPQSPAVAPPQPQHQVPDLTWNGSKAGPSGPPKTNARNEPQAQTAPKPSPSISGNANTSADSSMSSGRRPRPQPRDGPPKTVTSTSVSSTPSTRVGPPAQDAKRPRLPMTSTGGFHPPSGMPQSHTPKPVPASACVRTASNTPATGPTNTLKRSAETMEAGSGASTRAPMQGMGLAQREHHQQQSTGVRRPWDNSEGNNPKRLKH